MKKSDNFDYYHIFLLVVFLGVWIWSGVNPKSPGDWLIENILVFIFVPIILITARYFRLSRISYTFMTLFLIAHVIGSHYTYPEVPFGYLLQDFFGSSRNMYDRFVHFSFGLLLSYPIREVFLRIAQVRGIWGYYLPLDVTLSFSALYEIAEWATVNFISPADSLAFLGTQGDMWDTQKDMAWAGAGALITLFFNGLFNFIYTRTSFLRDLRDSIRIKKNDKPLGEKALTNVLRRK